MMIGAYLLYFLGELVKVTPHAVNTESLRVEHTAGLVGVGHAMSHVSLRMACNTYWGHAHNLIAGGAVRAEDQRLWPSTERITRYEGFLQQPMEG